MSRNLSLPILSSAADAAAWLRQHTAILCTDSRKVQAGHGFVAWPGAAHDALFMPSRRSTTDSSSWTQVTTRETRCGYE